MPKKNASFKNRGRVAIVCVLVTVVLLFYSFRLMSMQLADGEMYRRKADSTYYSQTVISASRGEILDRFGRPIAVNTSGYSIIFERAFLPSGKENETILKLVKLLKTTGESWNDTLPVSMSPPFEFLPGRESSVAALKKELRLNNYASVTNCMDALFEKYLKKGEKFTEEEKRLIVGIRSEMTLRDFSVSNHYIFASSISGTTAAKIEELSFSMPGIAISQDASRQYVSPETAPHVVGLVGPIFAEEYSDLKNKGYKMSDFVGKFGVEEAFEEYLKGTDGVRQTVQDKYGNVISVTEKVSPKPGNSVVLTLDTKLQNGLQKILEEHSGWLKSYGREGKNVSAMSCVVLDVADGGVLAMANWPSFSLDSYYSDYSKLQQDERNPLFNRATSGLYRPGSTFKTITGTAGLAEGVISASDRVHCGHVYTYFDSFRPTCLGTHGGINVVTALGYSCNIFFYDVGRRLGIDLIKKYASAYGYSGKTGIEIPEASGQIAGPDVKEQLGEQWYAGDVLQASIGQSDTGVTTLQMATVAMTIANNGTRYQTHLLKEVKSFDYQNSLKNFEKNVVATVPASPEVFSTIKQGMKLSASLSGTQFGLTNYKLVQVAFKTGTPQTSSSTTNNCILGFAPADNPKIAFAIMQENGYYSARAIRELMNLYFTPDPAASLSPIETLVN